MKKVFILFLGLVISLGLISCGSSSNNNSNDHSSGFSDNSADFVLQSNSFDNGAIIPNKYAKLGENISPQLEWDNAPTGSQSFVIIVDDLDAQSHAGKTWVHWNVFNINKNVSSLDEGASLSAMPAGSTEGVNSYSTASYGGPNPPKNDSDHDFHTYNFFVYAMNVTEINIDWSSSFDRAKFEAEYSDKIIDKAGFTAKYANHE